MLNSTPLENPFDIDTLYQAIQDEDAQYVDNFILLIQRETSELNKFATDEVMQKLMSVIDQKKPMGALLGLRVINALLITKELGVTLARNSDFVRDMEYLLLEDTIDLIKVIVTVLSQMSECHPQFLADMPGDISCSFVTPKERKERSVRPTKYRVLMNSISTNDTEFSCKVIKLLLQYMKHSEENAWCLCAGAHEFVDPAPGERMSFMGSKRATVTDNITIDLLEKCVATLDASDVELTSNAMNLFSLIIMFYNTNFREYGPGGIYSLGSIASTFQREDMLSTFRLIQSHVLEKHSPRLFAIVNEPSRSDSSIVKYVASTLANTVATCSHADSDNVFLTQNMKSIEVFVSAIEQRTKEADDESIIGIGRLYSEIHFFITSDTFSVNAIVISRLIPLMEVADKDGLREIMLSIQDLREITEDENYLQKVEDFLGTPVLKLSKATMGNLGEYFKEANGADFITIASFLHQHLRYQTNISIHMNKIYIDKITTTLESNENESNDLWAKVYCLLLLVDLQISDQNKNKKFIGINEVRFFASFISFTGSNYLQMREVATEGLYLLIQSSRDCCDMIIESGLSDSMANMFMDNKQTVTDKYSMSFFSELVLSGMYRNASINKALLNLGKNITSSVQEGKQWGLKLFKRLTTQGCLSFYLSHSDAIKRFIENSRSADRIIADRFKQLITDFISQELLANRSLNKWTEVISEEQIMFNLTDLNMGKPDENNLPMLTWMATKRKESFQTEGIAILAIKTIQTKISLLGTKHKKSVEQASQFLLLLINNPLYMSCAGEIFLNRLASFVTTTGFKGNEKTISLFMKMLSSPHWPTSNLAMQYKCQKTFLKDQTFVTYAAGSTTKNQWLQSMLSSEDDDVLFCAIDAYATLISQNETNIKNLYHSLSLDNVLSKTILCETCQPEVLINVCSIFIRTINIVPETKTYLTPHSDAILGLLQKNTSNTALKTNVVQILHLLLYPVSENAKEVLSKLDPSPLIIASQETDVTIQRYSLSLVNSIFVVQQSKMDHYINDKHVQDWVKLFFSQDKELVESALEIMNLILTYSMLFKSNAIFFTNEIIDKILLLTGSNEQSLSLKINNYLTLLAKRRPQKPLLELSTASVFTNEITMPDIISYNKDRSNKNIIFLDNMAAEKVIACLLILPEKQTYWMSSQVNRGLIEGVSVQSELSRLRLKWQDNPKMCHDVYCELKFDGSQDFSSVLQAISNEFEHHIYKITQLEACLENSQFDRVKGMLTVHQKKGELLSLHDDKHGSAIFFPASALETALTITSSLPNITIYEIRSYSNLHKSISLVQNMAQAIRSNNTQSKKAIKDQQVLLSESLEKHIDQIARQPVHSLLEPIRDTHIVELNRMQAVINISVKHNIVFDIKEGQLVEQVTSLTSTVLSENQKQLKRLERAFNKEVMQYDFMAKNRLEHEYVVHKNRLNNISNDLRLILGFLKDHANEEKLITKLQRQHVPIYINQQLFAEIDSMILKVDTHNQQLNKSSQTQKQYARFEEFVLAFKTFGQKYSAFIKQLFSVIIIYRAQVDLLDKCTVDEDKRVLSKAISTQVKSINTGIHADDIEQILAKMQQGPAAILGKATNVRLAEAPEIPTKTNVAAPSESFNMILLPKIHHINIEMKVYAILEALLDNAISHVHSKSYRTAIFSFCTYFELLSQLADEQSHDLRHKLTRLKNIFGHYYCLALNILSNESSQLFTQLKTLANVLPSKKETVDKVKYAAELYKSLPKTAEDLFKASLRFDKMDDLILMMQATLKQKLGSVVLSSNVHMLFELLQMVYEYNKWHQLSIKRKGMFSPDQTLFAIETNLLRNKIRHMKKMDLLSLQDRQLIFDDALVKEYIADLRAANLLS